MTISAEPQQTAAFIQAQRPNFIPKLALVLGSGLGELADTLTDASYIPYHDLPGFPVSTVAGHKGRLVLGFLKGMPIVCLQGRAHLYEGVPVTTIKHMVYTLKLLGCEIYFATNAAGSLHNDTPPGSLMMITDHINLQATNPLIGPNDPSFGSRFFDMTYSYDPLLQERLASLAASHQIHLAQGTYIAVLGPCYETPAEIRAFRTLGADAVGMSTVPEVIAARHCGLRVAAISAITNFAAGMTSEAITHEEALHFGHLAANNLTQLLTAFVASLQQEPC